ncbi:MAG: YdjY domain-containing protein [Planctomycetia bacterium]|nr:YdjY domain-containing protein [Planctomycetia bacterium]
MVWAFAAFLILFLEGCQKEEKRISPPEKPVSESSSVPKSEDPATIDPEKLQAESSETEKEEVDWKKYVEDDEYMAKPLELGELLVENPESLTRLNPDKPVWVDKENGQVILQGWVCQTRVPLEFFICQGKGYLRTMPYVEEGMPGTVLQFNGPKSHESILSVDVPASIIHAGLLAIGLKPGKPVQFQPEYVPPTGDTVEIFVRWKNAEGKQVECRGQEMIIDHYSRKKMEVPWVFAGSFFYKDDEGNQRYAADSEGEIVGVSNFPSVLLDVPQPSTSSNESLLYQANEKQIPPRGTPVTILLGKEKKETTHE